MPLPPGARGEAGVETEVAVEVGRRRIADGPRDVGDRLAAAVEQGTGHLQAEAGEVVER